MWALSIVLQHPLLGKEPELTTTHTPIFFSRGVSGNERQLARINFLRILLSSDRSQCPGRKEYLADLWICEDRNNASRALDMAGLQPEEHPRNPESAMIQVIENGNKGVVHQLTLDQDSDKDAVLVDGFRPTIFNYDRNFGCYELFCGTWSEPRRSTKGLNWI